MERDKNIAYLPINIEEEITFTNIFISLKLRNIIEAVVLTAFTFGFLFGTLSFIESPLKYIPMILFSLIIGLVALIGIKGESLITYLQIKSGLKKSEKKYLMKMPDVIMSKKKRLLFLHLILNLLNKFL
ncbi:MAG: hypothetical protein LBD41_02645 [Clostridiales Family XIII bacterium]|jgi:hypothetical protein|nr:hypothetical protein [Clostridiales Family XIII bacterium]